MKIGILNSDTVSRNHYITLSIARAFRAFDHETHVLDYLNLYTACREHRFEILLVVGGAGVKAEVLAAAQRFVPTSILWTSEDPYELEANVKSSKSFDIVFTNDVACLPYYENAYFLPFAADPKLHVREPIKSRDAMFDLFFVGTAWPERIVSLNKILRLLPRDLKLKFGLSGNPFLPDFHVGDLNIITNFRLAPSEFASMANASRVTLTLDRSFSASDQRVPGTTPPPRIFELAAAAAPQVYLTQGRDITPYFSDRTVALAHDEAGAAKAITDIVADPQRRDAMAVSAQATALERNLYRHRVQTILETYLSRTLARPDRTAPSRRTRPRVLIITHNIEVASTYGGGEMYEKTMADKLVGLEFFFLFPNKASNKLCLADNEGHLIEEFDTGIIPDTILFDDLREVILARVLREMKIDLVDIHHLLGHPLTISLIPSALGVPFLFHVHDYYAICHEFNLIGIGDVYCNIDTPDTKLCDKCLILRGVAPPGSQQRRRLAIERALSGCAGFIHNVRYTETKLLQVYPTLSSRPSYILGSSARPSTLEALERAAQTRAPRSESEKLQVCVLGNFTRQKGADILISIFRLLANDPIDIKIVGRVSPEFTSSIKQSFPNVEIIGHYDQQELPQILARMDASIHFSIWPETYCISVDEAQTAGVVPIVLGLGALAERVEDERTGFVIDPDLPYDLIKVLRSIAADRQKLEPMREKGFEVQKHNRNHFDRLANVYREVLDRAEVIEHADGPGQPLSVRDLGLRLNARDWREGAVTYDDAPARKPSPMTLRPRAAGLRIERLARELEFYPTFRPGDDQMVLQLDDFRGSIVSDLAVFPVTTAPRTRIVVAIPDTRPIELQSLIVTDGTSARELPVEQRTSDGFKRFHAELESDFAENVCFALSFDAGDRKRYVVAGPYLSSGGGNKRPYPVSDWAPNTLKASETVLQSSPRHKIFLTRQELALRSRLAKLRLAPLKARAHIDSINKVLFKKRADFELKEDNAKSLRVVGWVVPTQTNQTIEYVELRLISAKGIIRVGGGLTSRPDLSRAFKREDVRNCGFSFVASDVDLRPGPYLLSVHVLASDASFDLAVGKLVVMPKDEATLGAPRVRA